MSTDRDHLSVRTRLLLSGLVTFVLVLAALIVSWRGYVVVNQAGIAALRYANDATFLQALIKDINQYVLTEGAPAVRLRIQDSLNLIDGQLVVDESASDATRSEAQKLAAGWADVRVGVADLLQTAKPSVENFEVLGKVVKVVARLDGLGGEVNVLAERARSEGATTARRVGTFVGAMFAAILLFIAGIFVMLDRSLRRQLGTEPEAVSRIVHRVAVGDLLVDTDPGRQGFLPSSLLGAMQQMINRLTEVVRSIDDTNRQIAQSAFQIATVSRDMAESNAAQQARAQAVQSAIEDLNRISAEVHALADAAKLRTERTEAQADDGLRAVAENQSEMKKTVAEAFRAEQELQVLADSAKEINKIIESIAAIAAQTNLLSLNAAIEAARAGEQGRGFAVVADEVRKLANRTSDATKEITAIVDGLSKNILRTSSNMSALVDSAKSSNEKSQATGQAIEKMVQLVHENDCANLQISDASGSQMQTLAAFSESLATLFATLQENHAKVGLTGQISGDLYHTVESASRQMGYFHYDRMRHPHEAQHEKRGYPRVNNSLLVGVKSADADYRLVARDFSMGGLCLRSAEPLPMQENDIVDLTLMRPYETLDEYERQTPCAVRGLIKWVRAAEEAVQYGIEFVALSEKSKQDVEACFKFFRTSPLFESR